MNSRRVAGGEGKLRDLGAEYEIRFVFWLFQKIGVGFTSDTL